VLLISEYFAQCSIVQGYKAIYVIFTILSPYSSVIPTKMSKCRIESVRLYPQISIPNIKSELELVWRLIGVGLASFLIKVWVVMVESVRVSIIMLAKPIAITTNMAREMMPPVSVLY